MALHSTAQHSTSNFLAFSGGMQKWYWHVLIISVSHCLELSHYCVESVQTFKCSLIELSASLRAQSTCQTQVLDSWEEGKWKEKEGFWEEGKWYPKVMAGEAEAQ